MRLFGIRQYNISVILLILITFTPVSVFYQSAQAAVVDSKMIAPDQNASTKRDIDVKKIKRALENKIVAEKLMGYGLTRGEVIKKLDSMSDEQVHQIASLSDRIPAGGDSGLGIVIAILVIVALALLIIILYRRVK